MRKDLQEQLYSDYPTLFANGCSCNIGNGREALLRRLCAVLHADPTLRFVQIKEKFGGLRIYTDGGSSYASQVQSNTQNTQPRADGEGAKILSHADVQKKLREVMMESFTICEQCGDAGKLAETQGGWIFATCQECLDMRNANGNGRISTWVETNAVSEESSDAEREG